MEENLSNRGIIMKKIVTIVLVIALCLVALPSCNISVNQGYKIAVVPKQTNTSWFIRMGNGVKEYNEENGTDYFFGGPTDAVEQVQYLEQLLAEDWDAICVVPFDTESIAPILEKAKKEGILIITHEADALDEKYFDYDIEAFKSEDLGTHYGEYLVEKTGGEGTYIQLVGSLNSVTHNIWCDSAEKYISENSNLKKLGRYETHDDLTEAYNKTKEILQAHPEVNAIQCSASTDVPGAARAIEELGLSGKIVLTGTSLTSCCGQYVESGTVESFSLWDPAMAGKAMLNLAEQILSNDAFDINNASLDVEGYKEFTLDGRVLYGKARTDVTKDNMKDYDF